VFRTETESASVQTRMVATIANRPGTDKKLAAKPPVMSPL